MIDEWIEENRSKRIGHIGLQTTGPREALKLYKVESAESSNYSDFEVLPSDVLR